MKKKGTVVAFVGPETLKGGAMDDLGSLSDCVVTYEQTRDELEKVEAQLGRIYGVSDPRFTRPTLIALDKQNLLAEDELVMKWHDLYASFRDWERERKHIGSGAPPIEPCFDTEESAREAAQAASSFL